MSSFPCAREFLSRDEPYKSAASAVIWRGTDASCCIVLHCGYLVSFKSRTLVDKKKSFTLYRDVFISKVYCIRDNFIYDNLVTM